MVRFETQVYHKEDTDVVGAEVIVIAETGEQIGTLQITSKTEFDEIVARLNNLTEEFIAFDENSELAGMSIDEVLSNLNNDININASKLGGYTANQYSKTSHTHTKDSITDLHNVDLSISDVSPKVGDTITVTAKVTNNLNQPVQKSIIIYLNGNSWKSGTTNASGVFSATYTVDSDSPLTFKVENQKCIIYPAPEWVNVTVPVGELKVCPRLRLAEFSLTGSYALTKNVSLNFNNNNAVIPSDYRPTNDIRTAVHGVNVIILAVIYRNGKLRMSSNTTGTYGTTTYLMWRY